MDRITTSVMFSKVMSRVDKFLFQADDRVSPGLARQCVRTSRIAIGIRIGAGTIDQRAESQLVGSGPPSWGGPERNKTSQRQLSV